MNTLPYELIALDLDLTLLDEHHAISPRNLSAVKKCTELGVKVVIVSGRMYCTTLKYLHQMQLDTPVIAYNGSYIKNEHTGEKLLDVELSKEVCMEVVEYCKQNDLHLNYYYDDVLYVAKETIWSELYCGRTGAVPVPVGDLATMADKPATKLIIVDDKDKITAMAEVLAPKYAGNAYVTISNAEYLEFMPPTVDKGKALAIVAEYFNVPQAKVIAFGDARNDIPMLKWAGLGVAMENARPETIEAADITAEHHNEDGVAKMLEEIFKLKIES
jgi:Cof subfamily protein (haloacid dehalogenase superfamily)